jgi:hypothetical protein
MKIYVVTDYDGNIDSIYDEQTFKNIYKKFVDSFWIDCWHKIYDVVSYELNKDWENNNASYVSVEDVEKL